jgi:hypothetical protein
MEEQNKLRIEINKLEDKNYDLERLNNKLQTQYKLLQNEYIDLEKLSFGLKTTKQGRVLDNIKLEHINKSLTPLKCVFLKTLNKLDLLYIILTRERMLYDKINEFEESIKHNDRNVFRNLKKENERLHNLLMNDSELYFECKNKDEVIKLMEKEIAMLKIQINRYKGKIQSLKHTIKLSEKLK